MADALVFPDFASYSEWQRLNPDRVDDGLFQALHALIGDDAERWVRAGRHLQERAKDMGAAKAIASVRADLEARRL